MAVRRKLREALAQGAAGVQVGTAFAFCEESGLREDYKQALLAKVSRRRRRSVFTDPLAFAHGISVQSGTAGRHCFGGGDVHCTAAHLRPRLSARAVPHGDRRSRISLRLRAREPYLAKGGRQEDTVGRKCVCNALLANIGLAQVRNGKRTELALITAGDDLVSVGRFLRPGRVDYSAKDVIELLLTGCDGAQAARPASEIADVCFA